MKRNLGIVLLTMTTSLFGQTAERIPTPTPIELPATRCPFPRTLTVPGGKVASPVASDFPVVIRPLIAGSVWNQTAINKAFGHTFRFPVMPRQCCLWNQATLTVNVKALQESPKGGANASNDSVNVYSGGVAIGQQLPWTNGAHKNDTKTLTFQINAPSLTTGMISIYVQDDTAVVSADLVLTGCCLARYDGPATSGHGSAD
jgi:hypothetical protein